MISFERESRNRPHMVKDCSASRTGRELRPAEIVHRILDLDLLSTLRRQPTRVLSPSNLAAFPVYVAGGVMDYQEDKERRIKEDQGRPPERTSTIEGKMAALKAAANEYKPRKPTPVQYVAPPPIVNYFPIDSLTDRFPNDQSSTVPAGARVETIHPIKAKSSWFPSVDSWFGNMMGSPKSAQRKLLIMALCGLLMGLAYGAAQRDSNLIPYAVVGALAGIVLLFSIPFIVKSVLTAFYILCGIGIVGLIIYSVSYFLKGH